MVTCRPPGGYSQGEVVFTLIWFLTVNELLKTARAIWFLVYDSADNVTIIAPVKFTSLLKISRLYMYWMIGAA